MSPKTSNKIGAAVTVFVISLTFCSTVAAKPLRLLSDAACQTSKGTQFKIEKGAWVMPLADKIKLDEALRNAEDDRIRFKAERDSLLEQVKTPVWWIVGAFTAGWAGGKAWERWGP